jgi:DNA-directed RNA polymerase subunit N (RpoN/RPB10)
MESTVRKDYGIAILACLAWGASIACVFSYYETKVESLEQEVEALHEEVDNLYREKFNWKK